MQKTSGIEETLVADKKMKEELGDIYDLVKTFIESEINMDIQEPLLRLYDNSLHFETRKNDLLFAERSIVVAGLVLIYSLFNINTFHFQ